MANIESYGTQAPLKTEPRSMEPENKHTSGIIDSFGTKAPLSTTAVSSLPGHPGKFAIDSFATRVDLDTTPQKGWKSYPLPMSKRSIQASK